MSHSPSRTAGTIAGVYALVAGLWIILSDRAVEAFAPAAWITCLQTYKGWAFVGGTALLLFFALRRQCRILTLAAAEQQQSNEALRESEKQFRTLFEQAPVGIFQSTPEGRYLASNPRHAAILGYESPADLINSIQDIAKDMYVTPMEREPIQKQLLTQGSINNIEVRRKRKDGSIIWVSLNARVVRDDAGQIRFHGFITDITQRKQAESEREVAIEAQRQSELRFRTIFERSPIGLLLTNEHGVVLDCNEHFATIFGTSREKYLGVNLLERLPDGPVRQNLADSITMGGIHQYEGPYTSMMTGKNLYLRGSTEKIGPNLFIIIAEDITASKQAEKALLQSETIFRAIFEHAPIGLVLVDEQSVILNCNQHIADVFGVTREQYLGLNILQKLPDGPLTNVVSASISQGGVHHYEGPHTSFVTGRKRQIHIFTEKITSNMYIGIIEDITERKQMEAERLELERRLFQSQKLESLGILAGGIAHDFNNLLAVILGNLELAMLQLSPLSPARPKIEQAEIAAKRSADLTRQMLAYSGKGHFIITNIDVGKLVQENAHLFTAILPKGADLKLNLTEDLPYIAADIGQIQQVVMNLITNAAEALGDDPGVVTLSTGVTDCDEACLGKSRAEEKAGPGRFVFLEVADTGCGMDEDTLARFFDPFFSTKFTGRGLGMSAVLGIVRGHKGAIFVDSRVGQGTSIRVLFPVSGESIAVGQLQPTSKPVEPKLTFSGTILMVDDEEMIRVFCSSILKAMGFKVLTAANGEQAISLLRDNAKDIICVLLDLTMPRMDGLAAFTEMQLINPNIPVILSSGYSEQDAVQRFPGKKPSGFLQKPFQVKELKAELARVLAGR